MRLKFYALIISFHERRSSITRITKRKYLKTPTIREDGEVYIHECMESSHFLHDICSRPEHEMVRITEHDLCLHLGYTLSCDSLDSRCCSNRHKNWCLNNSVRSLEDSRTSVSISKLNRKRKHNFSVRYVYGGEFGEVFFKFLHQKLIREKR